jgi:hypothetical protein
MSVWPTSSFWRKPEKEAWQPCVSHLHLHRVSRPRISRWQEGPRCRAFHSLLLWASADSHRHHILQGEAPPCFQQCSLQRLLSPLAHHSLSDPQQLGSAGAGAECLERCSVVAALQCQVDVARDRRTILSGLQIDRRSNTKGPIRVRYVAHVADSLPALGRCLLQNCFLRSLTGLLW